jgi:RND family efflux transporter MFP subunit
MQRFSLTLILPLLLLSPAFAVTTAPASPDKSAAVSVSVATAMEQEIPVLNEIVGTLQAAERAAIAAKITGVITRIPVVLGSAVKKGDLLVAISAEEIAARLHVAEAQLAQAKRNLDREQNLFRKNAATEETVKSTNEFYAIALAKKHEAQTMQGYTTITAPFDGVVTRKNANNGDLASPGTVLLRIENNQKLEVATAVPESLILNIHAGDTLSVMVPAAAALVEGTVTEIAPAADPNSRTTPVILALPFHPNLRTGQFARVLLPGKDKKALLIPTTALVPSGQMDRVFVVENSRACLRLVRTGLSHNSMTEILTGLNPGETVITTNNQRLVNGQNLQIMP